MRLKMLGWLPLLSLAANAQAQQAPWGRPNVPISRQDRVYAADQTSNTVSVIDPVGNRLPRRHQAWRSGVWRSEPAVSRRVAGARPRLLTRWHDPRGRVGRIELSDAN